MDLYLVLSNTSNTSYRVVDAFTDELDAGTVAREFRGMVVKVPVELISDYRPEYRREPTS